jgi:L-asparagine oxygenase
MRYIYMVAFGDARRRRDAALESLAAVSAATLMSDMHDQHNQRTMTIVLNTQESEAILGVAREVAAAAARAPDTLAQITASAAGSLPPRLVDFARQVRRGPRRSYWILTGLAIDERRLGPTPESWRERNETVASEEAALLLVGQTLGTVFAWADQQGGATVHDIVPSAGEEQSLLSSSSTKEMSLHTEDAFFEERGDLILLLCLRNPSQAPTHISNIRDVSLSAENAEMIRSPRYLFRPDDSHDGSGPRFDSGGFPVVQTDLLPRQTSPSVLVSGTDSEMRVRFDSDYIDAPGDTDAIDAARALDSALYRARTEIVLQPGELLIIDNNQCVHGRGGFHASLNGRDRWLKRISVSTGDRSKSPGESAQSAEGLRAPQ